MTAKRKKVVRIIVIVLALIGALTVIDNTYRLGKAVVHTITSFRVQLPHVVDARR